MTTLYEFQQQALDAEARHRAEHQEETRLAIVLPTGTGKGTILAERAVRFIQDAQPSMTSVLIIVHTDELVNDLASRCRLAGQGKATVGIVKAESDETDADIIVASRQTLENPARRARIRDVGLVIVDECHIGYTAYEPIMRHFGCFPDYVAAERMACAELDPPGGPFDLETREAEVEHILNDVTPALGFTATMERSDGAGLGQVWQNVVFTRDISWAVRKGYLVQPIGYRLEIEPETHQHGTSGWSIVPGVQDEQLCDSIAPERIVEKWQELASDRQTIVFAPLVRSAKAIADAFTAAGIGSQVVYGDLPEATRRGRIECFKKGLIQVLVNAMILTAGFDHPGIGCVVVARPTKSRTLFVQMAGRGLRRDPTRPVEEQDCVLITLADGTEDLCSIADLSDRPMDRKVDGPLIALEDQWDLGKGLEDAARHWTGRVDVTRFDPIVARSSKVWRKTKGGVPFLPISKEREYLFVVGTDVWIRSQQEYRGDPDDDGRPGWRSLALHRNLPDLETALRIAEDEATERGGDIGALLADRTRPWRDKRPSDEMIEYARRLGLSGEVDRIMSARAGGKAGKVSDLISRVQATRVIDPLVKKIRERADV